MRAIARMLERLSSTLNSLALWGAVIAVVIMTLSATYQVVARYVFFSPPIWTEELARYAMVWAGLLGASASFRANADPVLFPARRDLTGRSGLAFAIIRAVGVIVFITPILYYSFLGPNQNPLRSYVMRSFDRNAELLGVSMFFFAVAIPVAYTLIATHLIADIANRLAELGESSPKRSAQ